MTNLSGEAVTDARERGSADDAMKAGEGDVMEASGLCERESVFRFLGNFLFFFNFSLFLFLYEVRVFFK